MNYQDTVAQSDPNSWDSRLRPSSRSGSGRTRGQRQESSRKRSDAKAAVLKAKILAENIELVTAKAVDKYGLAFVCGQSEWREALGVLRFLRMLLRDSRPIEFSCN